MSSQNADDFIPITIEWPRHTDPGVRVIRREGAEAAEAHAVELAHIQSEVEALRLQAAADLEARKRDHALRMAELGINPTLRRWRGTLAGLVVAGSVLLPGVFAIGFAHQRDVSDGMNDVVAAFSDASDEARGLIDDKYRDLIDLEQRVRRAEAEDLEDAPQVVSPSDDGVSDEVDVSAKAPAPSRAWTPPVTARVPAPKPPPTPAAPADGFDLGFDCDPGAPEGDPLGCL